MYREFVQTLIEDRSIHTRGCSGLFHFVVLCSYANFRTSYLVFNPRAAFARRRRSRGYEDHEYG